MPEFLSPENPSSNHKALSASSAFSSSPGDSTPLKAADFHSSRRRALFGLAGAALGIMGGCSAFRLSASQMARSYKIGGDVEDIGSQATESWQDVQARVEKWLHDNSGLVERVESSHGLTAGEEKTGENVKKACEEIWKSQGKKASSDSPLGPDIRAHEKEYALFLAGLGLKHILPCEVLRPHRNVHRGVANQLPPREMWNRLAPTLKVADEIRNRLGVPLRMINSVYRCPAYNATLTGAATASFHMKNCAMDLVYDVPPGVAAKVAEKLRKEGKFRGGIGIYPNFVHVDTRGYNANWEA